MSFKKNIHLIKIIVIGIIFSLISMCGHKSGDCNMVLISRSGSYAEYWVKNNGYFDYLKLCLSMLGDSDPDDCEFTINGTGMQEYTFKKRDLPDLNCEGEPKKYTWKLTSLDLRDDDGWGLKKLPGYIDVNIKYSPEYSDPYEDAITLQPYLQNNCKTNNPLAPNLDAGKFVSNDNNCYCPLTITYYENSTYTYDIYLFDGDITETDETTGEPRVDANPSNITSMIKPSDEKNEWIYNWQPAKSGTHFLQIGIKADDPGICGPSDLVVSGVIQTEAPCVNPSVKIENITKNDGKSIRSTDPVELKKDGPFTINVFAKTDDIEKPSSIKVTISYDLEKDVERAEFYSARTIFTNNNLDTFTYVPPAKTASCVYPITWDGRDGFDCRILLAGEYTVTATAKFDKEASDAMPIKVAKPNYINIGVDYPGSGQDEIDDNLENYKNDVYDFSKVSYLAGHEDTYKDFEWIRQLSILSEKVDVGDYNRMNKGGPVNIDENLLDTIQKKAAWFSFLGHAGVAKNDPKTGFLVFNGNNLYPECTALGYESACDNGDLCMDYKCDGTNWGGHLFDDVMLVVLNACRTNLGSPSVTERVINNGANCVISTRVRLMTMMENFWYQRFTEKLFVGEKTIADAAEEAFVAAINDIAQFHNTITDKSFEGVQEHFGTYEEDGINYNYIYDFSETLEITENDYGISKEKMVPARYGIPLNP